MIKSRILLSLFLSAILLTNCNVQTTSEPAQENGFVNVIINYGDEKPIKETVVNWSEDMTAMQALQHSANISSHPAGEYVFVTSIDSVYSKRGKMAWYYEVNDESTGILAINYKLNPGDKMQWIYKEDVCSPK